MVKWFSMSVDFWLNMRVFFPSNGFLPFLRTRFFHVSNFLPVFLSKKLFLSFLTIYNCRCSLRKHFVFRLPSRFDRLWLLVVFSLSFNLGCNFLFTFHFWPWRYYVVRNLNLPGFYLCAFLFCRLFSVNCGWWHLLLFWFLFALFIN